MMTGLLNTHRPLVHSWDTQSTFHHFHNVAVLKESLVWLQIITNKTLISVFTVIPVAPVSQWATCLHSELDLSQPSGLGLRAHPLMRLHLICKK